MRKVLTILLLVFVFSISAFPVKAGPRAEIKAFNGIPTLFIKNRPSPPFAYMSYLGETRFYREAAEAGIHLYCFPAYLGDRGINSTSGIGPFRPSIWTGENRFDYSSIENDFDRILLADPSASVIIRLHLDVPRWWEEKNPAECALQPDGTLLRQSFSSELWKKQAGEALEDCVRWLIKSPYSSHLAGIHVAAGFTEEWFYHFSNRFSDGSKPRIAAFRQWLRQRYLNDLTSLQKAWGLENIRFDNACPADIGGYETGSRWLDPKKDMRILDTFRFHASTMAGNIAYFCKIVKDTSDRALLTGAFYGYHFYVSDPRRGHGALSMLLECPDLDYLSSPNVYDRAIGKDWPPMAAVQSVQLHGKLWMAENDTRTSLTRLLKERAPQICPPGQYESSIWLGPPDISSSAGLLWKDAARMLCYGYGGWWFDMWGGWFSNPAFLKVLKSTVTLYNKHLLEKDKIISSQVCILADEELHFHDGSYGKLTGRILSNREALGKSGAPYDLYLRPDGERINVEPYRIIWFLGVPEINSAEAIKIQQWLASGITVLVTDRKGTTIHHGRGNSIIYKNRYTWTAEELRGIWRGASVHVYIDNDDILYAGNGWLGIHTAEGEEKQISLPFPANITDPLNGNELAVSSRSFRVYMAAGTTRLFRIERPVGSREILVPDIK